MTTPGIPPLNLSPEEIDLLIKLIDAEIAALLQRQAYFKGLRDKLWTNKG
jgi:hypothetical protein